MIRKHKYFIMVIHTCKISPTDISADLNKSSSYHYTEYEPSITPYNDCTSWGVTREPLETHQWAQKHC
jgi:hypothetical protein